jgi:hypothetical protein
VKVSKAKKICNKCNKLKLKKEFTKLATSKDGLNYYCRPCINEAAKKYYYARKNKKTKKTKK